MSNYSIDIKTCATMLKALGNPHRLSIFQRLTTCCAPGTICEIEEDIDFDMGLTVGEIGKELQIAPSTVSHHLKELHHAGLIKTRRNGKNIECWIEPEVLKQLSGFFNIDTLGSNENTKDKTKQKVSP